MKTVSIIGNRPQLVKLIPELADVCIWTGQHYDESLKNAHTKQLDRCGEVVELEAIGLGEMLCQIDVTLQKLNPKPEIVAVYGDTNSTFAGAMIARQMGIKRLVHVEAGLRCGNDNLPEEKNRIATDIVSTDRFCPTARAQGNLVYEMGTEIMQSSPIVGDIMQERLFEMWVNEFGKARPSNKNDKWICTVHRAENSPTDTMMALIKNIALYVNRPRIYIHPKGEHLFREWEKIRLSKLESAISYLEMVRELWNCEGVITDSGGLLREAAWLGKKCIVLRNECEFPELVEANRVKLVGRNEEALRDALEAKDWGCRVELENPGTTQKILDHLGIKRRFFGAEQIPVTGEMTEETVEVLCQ